MARPTILVVEDDPAARSMFRLALQSAGFVVIAVEDGLDALHRVEVQKPDAVVLDLALPRLDGRDVHRELAARPDTLDIPIVVVSGTDTSDLNPDDFACVLRKPVNPDVLLTAVENCLRQRPSRLF